MIIRDLLSIWLNTANDCELFGLERHAANQIQINQIDRIERQ
jgi:hypothetical protein